jgi:hypothetical protein
MAPLAMLHRALPLPLCLGQGKACRRASGRCWTSSASCGGEQPAELEAGAAAAPERAATGCCISSERQIQQQQPVQHQHAESIPAASAVGQVLSSGLAGWSEDWQAARLSSSNNGSTFACPDREMQDMQ